MTQDVDGMAAVTSDSESDSLGAAAPQQHRRWPYWPVVLVFVVGLLVTAALVVVSSINYNDNEKRLLTLRARDASAVLSAAVPGIQTPLASAAALADATHGNRKKFVRFIRPYVGSGPGHPFVSVSLWRVGAPRRGPMIVVGKNPVLAPGSPRTARFFRRAASSSKLTLIGLLHRSAPRLGYGFAGSMTGRFAAYAENALPASRYQAAQSSASFSDLNYAIYLGRARARRQLLVTSAKRVPLSGETATVRVPFADTVLTLSVSARGSLAGSLPQRLPWGIGIVGLVLTLGAVALTQRLIQGRRHAEALAGRLEEVAAVNRQLYAEQRGIAQTLQHALLPDRLPQLPGVQAVARYQAGVKGVEVGGDWYDLIVIDERRLLLVVGDVSGRGLRAATAMAALRYGIHAYAAQGDSPSEMLSKLSSLISVKTSGQMATVLCALVDVEARTVSITSAGHLLPLMIHHDNAEFVHADVGLPIGVDRRASYSSTTVPVPARATLLAFTDGLVERRGESIDVGLERLRSAVSRNGVPLEDLVTRVVEALRDDGTQDDTAIAGVQWLS